MTAPDGIRGNKACSGPEEWYMLSRKKTTKIVIARFNLETYGAEKGHAGRKVVQ